VGFPDQARQASVTFEGDGIEVDATIIAEGMGVPPQDVLERVRSGAITTRCEKGVDEDEGRYRLTFLSRSRRLQLIVDMAGKILQRSSIDFGKHPLPQKLRSSSG
jgi:hypothetical protein